MNTRAASTDPAAALPAVRRGPRRAVLWTLLVLLLVVAQSLLVVLTVSYETSRNQEENDAVGAEAALRMRRDLQQAMRQLQALSWAETDADPADWHAAAAQLMQQRPELLRVERRNPALDVIDATDGRSRTPLFSRMARRDLSVDTELACGAARRQAAPLFSRSYFVPLADGRGVEVLDLCIPVLRAGRHEGFFVGSFGLSQLLDELLTPQQARGTEITVIDGDGARLARAGGPRGAGVFVSERLVDLPGTALQLRVDSARGQPSLIPNLMLALVLSLSLALFAVVVLLARDVRRRAEAERALAEALSLRQAMEDSLITGLRARSLDGKVTYANPAFLTMVGFSADELLAAQPPYWPPEFVDQYRQRQESRRSAALSERQHEGYETVFMRKNGERFPVVIYEAPLRDAQGHHTGWMSTVLDVSAQHRVEELARQQQDRLQASARLATVGEMASLMSHELNQPLAAIASYAAGSLNLLDDPDPPSALPLLHQALERIEEQAERAGRIIKSVHSFVRRRDQQRETLSCDLLIDGVLPLVRLQARKSGTRIELDLPARAPRVVCDRTMLEQVLLNLSRNGIQAMETDTPQDERVLTLRARQQHPQWVAVSVIDQGPGISPEVAVQLFTPFFTTRPEGMGLGLSLCRTVIEQHGGVLDFGPGPGGRGTEFTFTLPAPRQAESREPAPTIHVPHP